MKSQDIVEKLVIILFIGLFVLFGILLCSMPYANKLEREATFRAWVKQTGNPKDLTIQEWDLLRNMEKEGGSTSIILLPRIH
jgi:hypothetical protein